VIGATTVPLVKVQGAAVRSGGGLISLDLSFDGPAHRGLQVPVPAPLFRHSIWLICCCR
jgi:hypothetical protein